jgi:hypothetical protein
MLSKLWKQELNQMIKWDGVSFFNDSLKMFKIFVCPKKDENQYFFLDLSWLVTGDLSLFIHFNSFFSIYILIHIAYMHIFYQIGNTNSQSKSPKTCNFENYMKMVIIHLLLWCAILTTQIPKLENYTLNPPKLFKGGCKSIRCVLPQKPKDICIS